MFAGSFFRKIFTGMYVSGFSGNTGPRRCLNMSDNKFSRFFSGKGYYIAPTLCAAAIGIMSYVYYSGQEQEAVQTANAPVSIVGTVSLPTRENSTVDTSTWKPLPTRSMLG